MKLEIFVAVVGLLGALLGGLGSAGVTYYIESKKMSEEGFSRPSTLLHEKRLGFCEELIVATDNATRTTWNIWGLTDYQDKMSDEEVEIAIKEIVSTDTTLNELRRIFSLCKIYGSESLVNATARFVDQYSELMAHPTHTVAMVGTDEDTPLLNAIRQEIGTDALSEHLLDQLHLRKNGSSMQKE